MENTITKITPEIQAEIKEVRSRLSQLHKIGVISIDVYYPEVLIRSEVFDANFPDIEAVSRECKTFPYEKSIVIDGIKYFAIYEEV